MGSADKFGSLEADKSADFILLDQDILALGDAGHADQIGKTKVLETWFKGRKVIPPNPESLSPATFRIPYR